MIADATDLARPGVLDALDQAGSDVIEIDPRLEGAHFCLFDTRASNGAYVELMELSTAMLASLALMEKAHTTWDGVSDPVRGMGAESRSG